MNSTKKFINSLIVLGLFLIFIPTLCHANGAMGFFSFPPIFFIFAVVMVLTIESLVINNRLDNNPRKAELVSFIINLCSTILGFVLSQILPRELLLSLSFISWIILLFVGTVIVEGIALSFFYSKSSMKTLFVTAFLMNLLSYVVLFGSGLIGSLPVFGTIIVFVIMVYLLKRFFGLFETTKELPNGEKISVKPGANAFHLILFFLIILLLFGLYIDSRPTGRSRAKDAAFKATAQSLVSTAMMCCEASGADFVIPPVNGGPVCNVAWPSSIVWPAAAQIDNISIITACQSDGSFKLRVQPGSSYVGGNCKAAECTQLGCTYTGC